MACRSDCWLSTTPLPAFEPFIPPWVQLWFAVFPTVETLVSQALAATIVLGSYVVAGRSVRKPAA
jgi:high-affinity iron transporter